MVYLRKTVAISLWLITCLLLVGGTGRPSDGFLSFILLFGFLIIVFGILSLIDYIKRRVRHFLFEIGEAIG